MPDQPTNKMTQLAREYADGRPKTKMEHGYIAGMIKAQQMILAVLHSTYHGDNDALVEVVEGVFDD